MIAPPFLSVHAAAEAARGSNIAVGAQNVHGEREGAFTGEVSAVMLREAGARFVIIGHSERRTLFGETDAGVNKKIHAVLTAGLTPIVCVGETLNQRDRNETLAVLDRQIKDGLDGVTGRAAGRDGHRLRARLGDRHRPQRHAAAGRRGAFSYSATPQAVVWARGIRSLPGAVWGEREA